MAGLIYQEQGLIHPRAVDERGIVSGPTVSQVEAALAACDILPAAILVTAQITGESALTCLPWQPVLTGQEYRWWLTKHRRHLFSPDFPRGLSRGVNLVNSAHKTLGALTPGAHFMCVITAWLIWRGWRRRWPCGSSSPAYPVMLSRPGQGRLQEHGRALFAGALWPGGRGAG